MKIPNISGELNFHFVLFRTGTERSWNLCWLLLLPATLGKILLTDKIILSVYPKSQLNKIEGFFSTFCTKRLSFIKEVQVVWVRHSVLKIGTPDKLGTFCILYQDDCGSTTTTVGSQVTSLTITQRIIF